MRIFTFTDTHHGRIPYKLLHEKSKDADVVVCAGDITVFGSGMEESLDQINRIGKPVLMIHGNHEDFDELKAASKFFKNILLIHKTLLSIGGVRFLGYGGGGFAREDETFEKFTKKVTDKLKEHKERVRIFISHGPPSGCAVDEIYGDNVGNKSYTDFLKKEGFHIAICGHLHENEGIYDQLHNTIVINPGPEGAMIEVDTENNSFEVSGVTTKEDKASEMEEMDEDDEDLSPWLLMLKQKLQAMAAEEMDEDEEDVPKKKKPKSSSKSNKKKSKKTSSRKKK